MNKTAMQEWIEWIKAYEYELPLELQIKAKQMLEKEKDQLYHSFYAGGGVGLEDDFEAEFKNYHNQTYNQNK